jgi:8-oxo-dGTP diphosphatase
LKTKQVVCAWIENGAGKVLLSQRKPGGHMALLWEFPGGKIEPGETPERALARELKEELNLDASVGRALARVVHAYAEFAVELQLYWATADLATLQPVDVHAIQFVDHAWFAAHAAEMPPADVPLIRDALAVLK